MNNSIILINLDTGDRLESDLPAIIGRGREADIHIADPRVSRIHAKIYFEGSEIKITDIESANGVFVNEIRIISPTSLQAGDVINIGKTRLKVESKKDEPVAETIILQSIPLEERL
jgi:pSer/pThr/pTyr-binding forkhead associated (FHA) protein